MSAVTVLDDPVTCRSCQVTRLPTKSLMRSGQIGLACAACGAEQGIAITGGVAAGLDDQGAQVKRLPVAATSAAQEELPLEGVAPPPRRPAARPALRAVPDPTPVEDEWSDPTSGAPRTLETVIGARLATVRLELARLKIDQCRMRGLEAEMKALEKELARLT